MFTANHNRADNRHIAKLMHKLKRDIETTFMLQRLNAKVRVLESELEAEVKLHKVWIGPILSTNREAMISTILSQMGLAKPVKVVAN